MQQSQVISHSTAQKLRAINAIREGNLHRFFYQLKINYPKSLVNEYGDTEDYSYNPQEISPAYYSESKDPEEFQIYKDWIVGFIGILQAEGL
jgi:hypothetical protein